MHLPLWPIFRQLHPNFITVRTAYASEIWAQLTKNLLTKSGTERFRENMNKSRRQDRIMNMSVKIAGVEFKNPVMEASGTFGSGMEYSEFVDLSRLGAVVSI